MFGIIGLGKMGMSILNGILTKNVFEKNELLLYDVSVDTMNSLKLKGFNVAKDEIDLFNQSDYLLLAVKPQNFFSLLNKLKINQDSKIILSIAAGISIDYIKGFLPNVKVARIMPNTPALINYGVSIVAYDHQFSLQEKQIIEKIFLSIGTLDEVNEEMINEIIPINGSFPAYGYYFMQSFIDSAIKRGVDPKLAKKLVVESMIGSAMMIKQSNRDIQQLINDVCSPNGTTIEGINVFDEKNLKEIIDEASIKCSNRAKELGKI